MEISPGIPQVPAVRRPDWLSRNWKWLVPASVLGFVLLVAGFGGCLFLILESSFHHSDCYIQALERARYSPQIVDKIGQPLMPGWLTSGSFSVSGPSGDADISIPISGPRGKGTIYVVAKKSAGEWSFQRLEVEVEGDDHRIDLLKAEETGAGEHH